MMIRVATALALLATPILAQTEEQTRAAALIGPMMQEVAPGRAGEVFTGCILAVVTPEELATLAASPAPSAEIGALLTVVLNRPETMTCAQAAVSQ